MATAFQVTYGLMNATFRILIFFFFWLASENENSELNDRRLAFIDEAWTWAQQPLSEMTLIKGQECPDDRVLLTAWTWPGTETYFNGVKLIQSSAPVVFTQWAHDDASQSFALCGKQIDTTFFEYAQETTRCEERGMKNCGNEDQIEFCVSINELCPITGFTITDSLRLDITRDNNKYPLSLVRIDSYGPCVYDNQTNIFPDVTPPTHLLEKWYHCEEIDPAYVAVNSILDETYYKINGHQEFYWGSSQTRTLYYKNYPAWSKSCNGEKFLIANSLPDFLSQYQFEARKTYITVIAYLLVCNYLIPGIPFLLRCSGSAYMKKLLAVDYLVRIILNVMLLYFAFVSLVYTIAISQQMDEIIGYGCLGDETQVQRFAKLLDEKVGYIIAAIAICFVLWLIEGTTIVIYGIAESIRICCRLLKLRKHKRDEQPQYEQVNQSVTNF